MLHRLNYGRSISRNVVPLNNLVHEKEILHLRLFNPLVANLTKCSNTLKQFVGSCRRIIWVCLTILWGCRLRGLDDKITKALMEDYDRKINRSFRVDRNNYQRFRYFQSKDVVDNFDIFIHLISNTFFKGLTHRCKAADILSWINQSH